MPGGASAEREPDGGFVSYFEVVDSERAQLAAELSIVRIDAQRQTATVDLIRALGIP